MDLGRYLFIYWYSGGGGWFPSLRGCHMCKHAVVCLQIIESQQLLSRPRPPVFHRRAIAAPHPDWQLLLALVPRPLPQPRLPLMGLHQLRVHDILGQLKVPLVQIGYRVAKCQNLAAFPPALAQRRVSLVLLLEERPHLLCGCLLGRGRRCELGRGAPAPASLLLGRGQGLVPELLGDRGLDVAVVRRVDIHCVVLCLLLLAVLNLASHADLILSLFRGLFALLARLGPVVLRRLAERLGLGLGDGVVFLLLSVLLLGCPSAKLVQDGLAALDEMLPRRFKCLLAALGDAAHPHCPQPVVALEAIEESDDLILLMLSAGLFRVADRAFEALCLLVRRLKHRVGERVVERLALALCLEKAKIYLLRVPEISEERVAVASYRIGGREFRIAGGVVLNGGEGGGGGRDDDGCLVIEKV